MPAEEKKTYIVGPDENETQLEKRLSTYENVASSYTESQEKIRKKAEEKIESIYGFYPSHLSIKWQKKGLHFWEIGATFIEDETRQAWIHIKKVSWLKEAFLVEVLAHEMVHALRVAFPSSLFEEHLAYLTSSNWRRFWGPLFFYSFEPYFFFVGYLLMFFSYWPLCLLTLFFILRLIWSQRIFKKCLFHLEQIVGEKNRGLCLFLTSREILLFSRKKPEYIRQFIEEKSTSSLRWKQIRNFLS